MPTPTDILQNDPEPLPEWIRVQPEFNKRSFENFIKSRVVFYPGAGHDEHALRLFGRRRSAHCFVYADYDAAGGYGEEPCGYIPTIRAKISEQNLISLLGWDKNHPFAADVRYNDKFYNADVSGAWTIFKRREDFDEKHGADFLVLFYVFDEAVRVFWNLWARRRAPDVKPPYAILLQDHGGGNWAPFCGDQAPLYNLADNTNSCPQWLLSGCNGMPWTGYQRKSDPEEGGMAAHARSLWSLEDATRQKHRPPELEKIVIRDPDPETRRLRELRQNWGIDE